MIWKTCLGCFSDFFSLSLTTFCMPSLSHSPLWSCFFCLLFVLHTGPQWIAHSGIRTFHCKRQHKDHSYIPCVGKTLSVSDVGERTQQQGSGINELYRGGCCEVGEKQLGHSDLCSTTRLQPELQWACNLKTLNTFTWNLCRYHLILFYCSKCHIHQAFSSLSDSLLAVCGVSPHIKYSPPVYLAVK